MKEVILEKYNPTVKLEEYKFLYIKLADARICKPVETLYGRFAVMDLYDENMKLVFAYDVFTIVGKVKIDFDYDKKMYRIFGYSGNIYLDKWVCKIIGYLE